MLEVKNVAKIYTAGNTLIPVLKNISFTIGRGDFIFLTGASGAGKTTLIKMLILQEYPTKGNITFENVPIHNLSKKLIPMYRRTLGVVFQDYKLLEHKTVFENIAFVLEILNKEPQEIKDTVYKLLELVNLKDRSNLFPRQLSGGEKRRVVIARAIANNPKILIADEPTGDLDQRNSDRIIEILLKINQAGTSILMTTHNMEIVEKYSSFRKWHLAEGELNTDESIMAPQTSFMHKLKKVLSSELFEKVSALSPTDENDLLGLTPLFLKQSLRMSDNQIRELITKVKTLHLDS